MHSVSVLLHALTHSCVHAFVAPQELLLGFICKLLLQTANIQTNEHLDFAKGCFHTQRHARPSKLKNEQAMPRFLSFNNKLFQPK